MSNTKRSYGTGSLTQRADGRGRLTWYGQWWEGTGPARRRRKKALGLVRTEGNRDGLTLAKAEKELAAARLENDNKPKLADRLTVSELHPRYIRELMSKGNKRSSMAAVHGHFTYWILPAFGHMELEAIKDHHLEDLKALMENGERPGGAPLTRLSGEPLQPKTIRNIFGTLSAMFVYARRKRLVPWNPVDEITLPKVRRTTDIRFLTPEEVFVLADAALTDPDYGDLDHAMLITAAMSGLRLGELCGLRWKDIDWKASKVRVVQNWVLGEMDTPKSDESARWTPLADTVAGALDRYYKQRGEPAAHALVFDDPRRGGALDKAQVLKRLRKSLRAAGLDEAHVFHDLRHTFGTTLAAQGVAIRKIQEWMGHDDIATTQIYVAYAPGAEDAKAVNGAFGREQSDPPITDREVMAQRIAELEARLSDAGLVA